MVDALFVDPATGTPYTELPVVAAAQWQHVDTGNTVTRTVANGATQFTGAWTATRTIGVVRLLTVLASTVSAGLGGTFVFEFSEDAVSATISESRSIGDFETVRDFDLINAGAYYRVKFTPSRALTGAEMVFITTTLRGQNDGEFVRLANQQIEEANAAMGQHFAYIKAFDPRTGKSVNVRSDETGALRTSDSRQTVSSAGSLFVESIRDDISISFSRDSYVDGAAKIVATTGQVGTATQNAAEGRAVFATGAGTNRICWYHSIKEAVYEAGHEIIGEQTVLVPALTGTAEVRWGFMEDDGAAGILNGIGWGLDVTGLFVWRTKAGVDASKVYRSAFNRDRLDGVAPTLFRKAGLPVAFQPTMNTLYRVVYEWLGISPPGYTIQSPQQNMILAHVDETSNSQTGTTIPEPSLPLGIRVFSGSMAAGLSVECGSWRGGIHTAKTILAGSTQGATGQLTVGLASDQVAPGPLAGRHSLRLKNLSTSARSLFFGFSSGVTVSNGDELAPGESIDMDLDTAASVYVITTSTGGAGVRCAWTELAG